MGLDEIKRAARAAANAEYGTGPDETAFDRAIDAAVDQALARWQPVAWFVKDFADGWIYFDNEADAIREVENTGAIMRVAYEGG